MNSPGAIRAAKKIEEYLSLSYDPEFKEFMERIIDHETHASAMLEALEAVEDRCDNSTAMDMVRAAIDKAEGK